MLHLSIDHVAVPCDHRFARRHAPQQLDRVADGRERVAQLVRERRDEAVLLLVGLAQRLLLQPALRHVHRDAIRAQRPAFVVAFGAAEVRDPGHVAVGPQRAQLVLEAAALAHRAPARIEEAGAVLGVDQREDALARRHEALRRNVEHRVHAGRPPQDVGGDVEVERAHAAGVERELEPLALEAQARRERGVAVGFRTAGVRGRRHVRAGHGEATRPAAGAVDRPCAFETPRVAVAVDHVERHDACTGVVAAQERAMQRGFDRGAIVRSDTLQEDRSDDRKVRGLGWPVEARDRSESRAGLSAAVFQVDRDDRDVLWGSESQACLAASMLQARRIACPVRGFVSVTFSRARMRQSSTLRVNTARISVST